MPKLTVEGFGTFDAPQGKRLVLALIDEAGVDQLHACGGNCRCTTCRVEIVSGDRHEAITLSPSDAVTLVGRSTGSLRPYSVLTLHLTTPAGRSGSVSFNR